MVCEQEDWAPSQYPKRRLSVRSRKVSKPRDLNLELSDRSEIWQILRQQCCRCACQISKRYDNLKYQYRGFETLRDLTERRLFGYWDGAQVLLPVYPWNIIFKSEQCSFSSLKWDNVYNLNTLRPREIGRHFADEIFKWIFLNENVWISINISLKFVSRGSINDIPTLVQEMAWRRPGDKPLSEPMMVRLPTHICVTRPQWVNVDLLGCVSILPFIIWPFNIFVKCS